MRELNEVWDSVLKQMSEEISSVSFETWIKPVTPVSIDGNDMVLSVKSSLSKNMLMTKFRSMIESCLELAAGTSLTLNVVVEEEGKNSNDRNNESEADPITRKSELNPRYSFENFVVGGNNNLAYGAALAVAETPGQKYNPLFLYGGSGLDRKSVV